MASILKVDTLQSSNGTNYMVNGYPQRPGQIIEYLSSPCDGSTVTVGSGSYTFQNVTTAFGLTDSYVDITGSPMSYVPPSGATRVIYNFDFSAAYVTSYASSIFHMKFFIDSTEVVYARRTHGLQGTYLQNRLSFTWPIAIGGTDNANTGRLATWTTPKTLKLQIRRYSVSYPANIHLVQDWDGGGGTTLTIMPTLSITAIA